MTEQSPVKVFGEDIIKVEVASHGFAFVTTALGTYCCDTEAIARAYVAGLNDGADIELEACEKELKSFGYGCAGEALRQFRRPKPPSPKKKAKNALALAMHEAGKGGRIFDSSPFMELQTLIEELPDA